MKTNKTTILWIVIVLLAVLNITTIGTIIYNNSQAKDENENIVFEPDAQPINGRYFKQTLGFDGEQMDVYRQSNRMFRRSSNRIIGLINEYKEELSKELQENQPDTAKLKEISLNIGKSHAELKEVTVKFYLELNETCSPEQKVKLRALFLPLFRETPVSGNRHGHGNGGHGHAI